MDFLKENYTPAMIEELAKEGHVVIDKYQVEMSRVYEVRGIRATLFTRIDREDGVPRLVNLKYYTGSISEEVSKQIDELTERFNKSIGKKVIRWLQIPWRSKSSEVQVSILNAPPKTQLEYINQLEDILCAGD